MRALRPNSLRARLIVLVALAIIPMALMTILSGERERANAIGAARSNLERLTALAAANEAQSLERARQILHDLSSVPGLLANPVACSALMRDILSKNDGFVNFGLIQPNGDVLCSAVASDKVVNLADRDHFKRAVAERRFIAGNYIFGRVVQRHTVNLTYPVLQDGAVAAVLFSAIDLASLDKYLDGIELPPGSELITADADGIIMSRRPDSAGWYGKALSPALWSAATQTTAPVMISGTDGIVRLFAFAPVGPKALSGYTVMIGMPQADIVAAADQGQLVAAVSLAMTLALALLAAWFGGDILVVRRVKKLAQTANLIATGSLGTRTGMRYENEEISELARSLDDMARTLERKEAERNAAEALLHDADKRKDEFLAMLAHELRNPMAPISAGAQLLKHAHADNPAVARTADIIARQVDHMKRLVDDLLDVSRVTRGAVQLERKVLCLRSVVLDAVEQINPLFERRQQHFTLNILQQGIGVVGDQKRLVQVFANLLANAAKYTPEHGRIELCAIASAGKVTLTIADNGAGISAELLGRVFELFAQGERGSDRAQGGLGLGLALVKMLVNLHGGVVRAVSEGPGKGSAFIIELPCCSIDSGAPGTEQAAALAPP